MQDRSRESEPTQEGGSLPTGQGDQGPAPTPFVPLPEEGSKLGDVLSSTASEVPPKRRRKRPKTVVPEQLNLERERQLYDKWLNEQERKGRPIFNQKKRGKDLGPFKGQYKFKKAWFYKKVGLDEKTLRMYLGRDSKLKDLYKQLAMPRHEVSLKMRRQYASKVMPRINRKILELQAEIDPVVNQIHKLDVRMRRLLNERAFHVWQANHIRAPSAVEIRRRIKSRIQTVKTRAANWLQAKKILQLRKDQGFWNWLRRKSNNPWREDGQFSGKAALRTTVAQQKQKETNDETGTK